MIWMQRLVQQMQPLGRALMLPIAVLPIAGLLLRIGQPDLLNLSFIATAGDAIFGHLGLLFAIGVGVGLARENHGSAGLAGAVAFVVLTEGAKALLIAPTELIAGIADPKLANIVIAAWKEKELAKLGVPAGIVSGLAAGFLYNRYANIRMPEYLAFFGGRRFVPIAAGIAGLGGALVFGYGFPLLESGIDGISNWVTASGSFGLFAYGALNRLLIVTGLHHVLNNVAWFVLGDFQGATGDLNRFFAGDPQAGAFMSGYFPVMMFGLPAACLAMYRAAAPNRRKEVGGMLLSLGLTSFLTGVTEPIEFTFMFLAPALYAIHVVLTGLAMVIMDLLGVRLGFSFSAGLFDYVLNFSLASRPLLLIPVGLAYSAVYYAAFTFAIRRFSLTTPGREAVVPITPGEQATSNDPTAKRYVLALGGAENLLVVDACTTRLRLVIADQSVVNEAALKTAGARGSIRIGDNDLQVVIGPMADQLAGEIRAYLAQSGNAPVLAQAASTEQGLTALKKGVLDLAGGLANIKDFRIKDSRLVIALHDVSLIDTTTATPYNYMVSAAKSLHIINYD